MCLLQRLGKLTTGGLTPKYEDTIVVCIIDDGVNRFHPDIIDNLWVNHNEIPGNGIDDDSNGYVDDYLGWNIFTQNDSLHNVSSAPALHGTRVASMAGAKGNNTEGVSSVNWNVKLMIVVAEGDEAEALLAYDYPITMRKMYNESNGAEGAFVVSTNISWGIDNGKPEDAPLWCAIYDTLGKYGILNAAATANRNVDVDLEGDLPTACTSDFLITVTSSNAQNTRVNGAAYGKESIDLAAPGALVYGLTYHGYGYSNGTSFASPMVAGAVGLMYSYLCDELEDLVKQDPERVALYIKTVMMAGVETNVAFANNTKSGGKLNLRKSLEKIIQACWDITSQGEALEAKSAKAFSLRYIDEGRIIAFEGDVYSWKVINMQGQTMLSGKSEMETEINTSRIPVGTYILEKAENSGEIERTKFVVF
jgi:serine protease